MNALRPRNLGERIGRRGASLLTLGVIWGLFGLSMISAPAAPAGVSLYELIPQQVFAVLWIASSLVAIVSAGFTTPGHDAWGFIALIVPLLIRVASFTWAWVMFLVGHGGSERGWITAVVWSALIGLIVVIAGWAEPPATNEPRGGPSNV